MAREGDGKVYVFSDNQATISTAKSGRSVALLPMARAICARLAFTRDVIARGLAAVGYVASGENKGDLGTKGMDRVAFQRLRTLCGIVEPPPEFYADEHRMTQEEEHAAIEKLKQVRPGGIVGEDMAADDDTYVDRVNNDAMGVIAAMLFGEDELESPDDVPFAACVMQEVFPAAKEEESER